MRTTYRVFGPSLALIMVASAAVGAAAQDGSPGPDTSASPEPMSSPASQEAEAVVAPLPVADYWGKWNLHKQASHARVETATNNANDAAKSKKVRFYRELLGVHGDELQWLANHQPEDCFADEYESWRRAVEDLQAVNKKALAFARKDSAKGLKRTAKQQRAATKQLDAVLSNVADCVDSVTPVISGKPAVGAWTARPTSVSGKTIDKSPRLLSISDSGKLLLRVPRHPFCRESGYGSAALTVEGEGEMVPGGTPGFRWEQTSVDCHPKGKGRVNVGGGGPERMLAYDPTTDVQLMGSECYWRDDGGSPEDCAVFWRGTPPASEAATTPTEDAVAQEEEVTASPEEG